MYLRGNSIGTDDDTDDRRQTTDDRRQTTDDRRQTTDDRQQTTDNRQQTTDDRRQTTDDRRQTTDDRRQTTTDDDGRHTLNLYYYYKPIGASPRRDYRSDEDGTILAHNYILHGSDW